MPHRPAPLAARQDPARRSIIDSPMFEYTALVDAPVQRFTSIVTGPINEDEAVTIAVLMPDPPFAVPIAEVPAMLDADGPERAAVSPETVSSDAPIRAQRPAPTRAVPDRVPVLPFVPALVGVAVAAATMWFLRRGWRGQDR